MTTRFYKSRSAAKREATRQNNKYGSDLAAFGNDIDGYYVDVKTHSRGPVKYGSLTNR